MAQPKKILGAELNFVGSNGSTALGEASKNGTMKMVSFLMSQRADLEVPSPCYNMATPVALAAIHQRFDVFDLLTQVKWNLMETD